MFAPATIPCWADLGELVEIINWSALVKWSLAPIFLTGFWIVANFLAKKKVQNRLDLLEGQLSNRVHAAEVAQAKIANLESLNSTHSGTISMQVESLRLKESQLEARRADYDKVFAAGKKEYQRRTALEKYEKLYDDLKRKTLRDELAISHLEAKVASASGTAEELTADLESRQVVITKAENRLKKARKLEGYLWHAKALQSRPKFRPLLERKVAIVSVLNLKGGVGKTTTVAQLGAAFARRGYRVLCIDLDLQGSLSTLLLEQSVISERFDQKRLLQHFFHFASDGANPKIAEFAQEVPSPAGRAGSMHILATTDGLAFAEFNLVMGWLLRAGKRDARFLLRKALHAKSLASSFDIILLDCPPLLNITCINALAASDYLLIPALPSIKSLERVINLLQATQSESFKTHVNQTLNLLGLLANRTHHSGLTQDDQRDWDLTLERIKNIHGVSLNRFATEIPQLKGIQEGDTISATSKTGSVIEKTYGRLADELERAFPHDCRRTPPLLPKSL